MGIGETPRGCDRSPARVQRLVLGTVSYWAAECIPMPRAWCTKLTRYSQLNGWIQASCRIHTD